MADENQTRTITDSFKDIQEQLNSANESIADLMSEVANDPSITGHGNEPFILTGLTVFVLACIVGYYVVWRVTPALHSPLMGITNAISSVIIVGALMALAPADGSFSFIAFIGVILASINIFGGFIITRRMLHMFKKKES